MASEMIRWGESAALVCPLDGPFPERVLYAVDGGHGRGFYVDYHRRAGIVFPNRLPFQPVSFASSGGPKMSKPISADATAPNRTDAAATSLATFAIG